MKWSWLSVDASLALDKFIALWNQRGKLLEGALATLSQRNNANQGLGFQTLESLRSTAQSNTVFGYQNGKLITTGSGNTLIGTTSGISITDGDYNTGGGVDALFSTVHGYSNSAWGADAGGFNVDGHENTWNGFNSGFSNTNGNNNTGHGFKSLWSNLIGNRLVALGNFAGYYATGDDELYVNNQDRTDIAGDRSKSLLYGIFAATAANQRLRINAKVGIGGPATSTSPLNIQGLPTASAGLVSGDVWSNGGVLTVV